MNVASIKKMTASVGSNELVQALGQGRAEERYEHNKHVKAFRAAIESNILAFEEKRKEADHRLKYECSATNVGDEADKANAIGEREAATREMSRCAQQVNELRAALVKINCQEYGFCELCGDDMEIVRLVSVLTAKHCQICTSRINSIRQ